MNVLGPWSNQSRMGVLKVNQAKHLYSPILKQSRVCGRSVTFGLCNLDTGMTNTINLSPLTILSC